MQRKNSSLCRLISLSYAKLMLLEVVLPTKQLARSKERTDIQEKKRADAMTFSSKNHEDWVCSKIKRALAQTLG